MAGGGACTGESNNRGCVIQLQWETHRLSLRWCGDETTEQYWVSDSYMFCKVIESRNSSNVIKFLGESLPRMSHLLDHLTRLHTYDVKHNSCMWQACGVHARKKCCWANHATKGVWCISHNIICYRRKFQWYWILHNYGLHCLQLLVDLLLEILTCSRIE